MFPLSSAFVVCLVLVGRVYSFSVGVRNVGSFACSNGRRLSALVLSNDNDDNEKTIIQEPSSRREFFQKSIAIPAAAASVTELWNPLPVAAAATTSTSTQPSLTLPPIGLGAWAWGDSLFWGYNAKDDEELRNVFEYAVSESKSDTVLFDTAELYGFGRSETLLGQFSQDFPATGTATTTSNTNKKIEIASKFAAYPTRTKAKDVVDAARASVKRLGRPIDLYQIHFPNAWSNEAYWDGLADAYDQGLVKAVGVSNYGIDAMRACHAALSKRGIPLATNQIQLSLLYQYPLTNGLLDACNDLGIKVLSYSPLALGFLAAKYSKDNLPKGRPRQQLFEKLTSTGDYDTLMAAIDQIAQEHVGATRSQVALNWAINKGTIPIPGARTVSQVRQNYAALDWTMSKEEELFLEKEASKVTTFLTPMDSPMVKEDVFTKLKMFDS